MSNEPFNQEACSTHFLLILFVLSGGDDEGKEETVSGEGAGPLLEFSWFPETANKPGGSQSCKQRCLPPGPFSGDWH